MALHLVHGRAGNDRRRNVSFRLLLFECNTVERKRFPQAFS
jgi:hypothetical protein